MNASRCLCLAGLLVLIAPAVVAKDLPKKAPVLASRVELAAGDVKLGEEAGRRLVGTGTMLSSGSTLAVGPGGRCLVRMSDGTGLFLRDGTRLALRDDGVNLVAGEAWFDVPNRDDTLLQVQAGDARISAVKAGFDVRVEPGKVEVRVIRGLAVVESSGGRTEVGSGEAAMLAGGAAPKVAALDFWEDWTGGMADHAVLPSSSGRASGRIYAIDRSRPGAAPQDLQIREQSVAVTIRDDIATTEVTQSFFNPAGNPVEGWYWFTIPEGAAVTRFALRVDGRLIDGTVIERKQAAAQYEAAVQRAWDPALLEWVDGRTYRARIFPVPPAGERTVVLAYSEMLPRFRGTTRYVYPMGDDNSPRIQEFSLSVDLGDNDDLSIATVQGARIEGSGKDRRVTMRRSGFAPRGDFLLEMSDPKPKDPLRVIRYRSGRNEADYVMVRYSPEEDWDAVPPPEGVVVVVVDTSVGGDDGDRKLKTDAAEAILRALSSGDRFALLAADLQPRLVYPPKEGLANATEAEISKAMERLSEVPTGGALDLGEVFNQGLKLVHGTQQPAIVYIGDGLPTVGEMRSAEITERLKRSLSGSRARLFTMAVGMHANRSLLERLAAVGGGQALAVDLPEQTVQRAIEIVGAVKTPTITDLKIEMGVGLDQVFTSGSGKVTRGQEVLLYGRTHHPLPDTVRITGTLVGKPFAREYEVEELKGKKHTYAATLWAMENLRFLLGTGAEDNRGSIVALGLEYQLMTPYTSFLTLENAPPPPMVMAKASPGPVARDEARSDDDQEQRFPTGPEQRRLAPSVAAPQAPAPTPVATSAKVTMDAVASEAPAGYSGGYGGGYGRIATKSPPMAKPKESAPRGGLRQESAGHVQATVAVESRATHGMAASGAGDVSPVTGTGTVGTPVDLSTGRGVLLPQTQANLAVDRPSVPLAICSDASGRPLSIRRDLWARRLAAIGSIGEALGVYLAAVSSCEIDGWKAEKTLLDLVLGQVRSASDISPLLASFSGRPKVQDYLRTELLRRVVAPLGLLPTAINWYGVDAVMSTIADPEKRLAELRKVIDYKPGDPEGLRRLLFLLLDLKKDDEALAVAGRLRQGGYSAPGILVVLGDLQARKGDADSARKTYSELVEYNPWDAQARRMLGDVFLRHGWYEDAYRQYATLLLLAGGDPASILRFGRAAAGAGRTDEALRTFRKVLELSLEPSLSDPREWARLWSASAIAGLMKASAGDADKKAALERTLKRAELFRGPATLYLLTWNDLDADLTLVLKRGPQTVPTDRVDAAVTGLTAAFVPIETGELTPLVEWGSRKPARSVDWRIQAVRWDGKSFDIAEQVGTLGPWVPPAPARGK